MGRGLEWRKRSSGGGGGCGSVTKSSLRLSCCCCHTSFKVEGCEGRDALNRGGWLGEVEGSFSLPPPPPRPHLHLHPSANNNTPAEPERKRIHRELEGEEEGGGGLYLHDPSPHLSGEGRCGEGQRWRRRRCCDGSMMMFERLITTGRETGSGGDEGEGNSERPMR